MEPEFRGIHLQFLADTAAQIDLEGARYSGKSWVCSAKIVQSCLKYPGINWLACRYSNEETQTKIIPLIREMLARYGVSADWNEKEKHFAFQPVGGLISRIYCYGLKSIRREEELAKVRGLEMGGIWNDQSEETPEGTAQELPFGTRQPGYPHQVIYSPNPVTEDHFLADMFPEECTPDNPNKQFAHRNYYCLSIYDNAHNLPPAKIRELEDDFPQTHPKYKPLIMGMRGPNVTGKPVYESVYERDEHIRAVTWNDGGLLLEAFDAGKHHPVWVAAQRTRMGDLQILGGVFGKRLFLEDFMPVVQNFRLEWFGSAEGVRVRTCCDPPASDEEQQTRFTNIHTLKAAGLQPMFTPHANAPDVREATVQALASMMRRRRGFTVTNDPSRFLMVSSVVTKQSKAFTDALQSSYVWDEHFVSVGNKKTRQPKTNEWVEGWMRCLENIALNFCAGQPSDDERELQRRRSQLAAQMPDFPDSPHAWMM